MSITITELAKIIGGEVKGDGSIIIDDVAGIQEAKKRQISFLANPKYTQYAKLTNASALIVSKRFKEDVDIPLIIMDEPYMGFMLTVSHFHPWQVECERGIHPKAVIGENVKLGENISIAANVVIDNDVLIDISDNDLIMPPKVTWFEPKLRSGLFVHNLDE